MSFIKWSYRSGLDAYSFYPNVLRGLRYIHGEEKYIEYIYIYQGIFSAIANISLVEFIRKKYKISVVGGMIFNLLILATYSFTLPEAVSSHYIATESIAIPIFIISIMLMLKYYLDKSYLSLLVAIVLGYVLYKTRPQLIVFLVMYISFGVYLEVYKAWGCKNVKKFVLTFIIGIVVTGFISGCLFFGIIRGWRESSSNTQLIEAITGKALCVMNEDDVKYYDNNKELYMILYADVKARKAHMDDFPESILDYEAVQKKVNENITAHETVIWNYYLSKQGDDGGKEAFAARNLITSTEVLNNKWAFAKVVIRLIPSSLVASIFIQPEAIRSICYILTGLIYMVAVGVILVGVRINVSIKYLSPMIIVILMILVNSLASNIILYGQQRYVIYCMGLFYIALFVAVIGCYRNRIRDNTVHR